MRDVASLRRLGLLGTRSRITVVGVAAVLVAVSACANGSAGAPAAGSKGAASSSTAIGSTTTAGPVTTSAGPDAPAGTGNGFSLSKVGALYDMMIRLTKECPADDGACDVPDVQKVCASVFAELRGPSAKVGVPLQLNRGIFDSNTLVYGGTGVICSFDSNGVLTSGFEIRGGGGSSSGTCDLHCLNVPNAKTATIVPVGSNIFEAAVDWLAAPNTPGPKYTGYSYYHEWLATFELHSSDGSATKKLIAMAPELERFFAEVMKSMQPTR